MDTTSPAALRFGLIADGWHDFDGPLDDGRRLAQLAAEAESLGYELFSLSDHLHSRRPTFDPWTALTWVAAATSNITVVPNVLGLPYRHPPVLAKMAETLDRLSAGRLILGIGNGGYDVEFDAFGLPRRRPGAKVDALGEALQIIRDLLTGTGSTHSGTHYQTDQAEIHPAPRHPIPIWIGAYGERSLRQTGAHADGWLPSLGRNDVAGTVKMGEIVRAAATDAGRDPDAVTFAINVVIEPPGDGATDGATEVAIASLRPLIDAGFTTLLIAGLHTPDARRWFAHDVVAEMRAG
jgi:alkanesulfonate monooxygenase SsuD/methylene tetrahydromethanopterin reductase-like flavin-dependent oxidoreductase (luciferase family)